MADNDVFQRLTSYILSKPYVKISELESKFNLTLDVIYDYLESIHEKLIDLGLNIEILEVNNIDYCLIFIQTKKKLLTDIQLALLTIFALIGKSRGGILIQSIKNKFDSFYKNDIDFLERNYYIEKIEEDFWSVSPLGILTIFPVLEKSESLVEKLIL